MTIGTDERFAAIIEQEQVIEDEKKIAEAVAIQSARQEPKRLSFTPKRQHSQTPTQIRQTPQQAIEPRPRQLTEHQQPPQARVVARELGLAKQRHSTDFCGSHGPGTCCRSDEDRLAGRPPAVQRYSDIIVALRLAIVTCFVVGLTAATIRACWFLVTTILF